MIRACAATALVLGSCGTVMAEEAKPRLATLRERWVSSGFTPANTDSLAACRVDGRLRLFASAKDGDRIDVLDGETGTWEKGFGRTGAALGEFRRPNGVAIVNLHDAGGPDRPLLLVVERDGKRVQAVWADTLEAVATFGEGLLEKPYGVASWSGPQGLVVYVTDNEVPPERAVQRFSLGWAAGKLAVTHVGPMGEASGTGALLKTESVAVDARAGHVLLCDEEDTQHNVKVYTVDGKFTGTTLADGMAFGEPEGMAVVGGGDGGYIVLTDQQDYASIWHVFTRGDFRHVGVFTGAGGIANTDGVCAFEDAGARLFFAVDDDAAVRGYELEAIEKAAGVER